MCKEIQNTLPFTGPNDLHLSWGFCSPSFCAFRTLQEKQDTSLRFLKCINLLLRCISPLHWIQYFVMKTLEPKILPFFWCWLFHKFHLHNFIRVSKRYTLLGSHKSQGTAIAARKKIIGDKINITSRCCESWVCFKFHQIFIREALKAPANGSPKKLTVFVPLRNRCNLLSDFKVTMQMKHNLGTF